MWREKASVKSSHHPNGHLGRRDFRDNLFSVFISNINPVVDYAGMWGMFKPFGKVRDVYLSNNKDNRRSLYAFIRYGTLEEAKGVAQRINGMHIYGWPIAAKLAEYGWNKRRSGGIKHELNGKSFEPFSGGGNKDYHMGARRTEEGNCSYAEVVRKVLPGRIEERGEQPYLNWRRDGVNEEWLKRSAVGELIEFKNIEAVNIKLKSRGFIFSSVFLGGNSVLWTFESGCERDGFIKNAFFWKDCFSNMEGWKFYPRGASRMCWAEVYGVPADCWCLDFFKEIGKQVGGLVCVDEDTSKRNRLDRARILLAIAYDEKLVKEISVKGVHGGFSVRLKEDATQVTIAWINQFLGLRPPSHTVARSSMEEAENSNASERGDRGVSVSSRSQSDKTSDKSDDRVYHTDKVLFKPTLQQNITSVGEGGKKKKVGAVMLHNIAPDSRLPESKGGANRAGDKGKGRKIYRLNPKSLWFPLCKSGVRIGMDRRRKPQSSEEESSSTGPGTYSNKGPNFFVGEQSKAVEVGSISPKDLTLDGIGPSLSENNCSGSTRRGGTYNCGDDNTQISDQDHLKISSVEKDSFVADSLRATQEKVGGQGISLCIDLRDQGTRSSGQTVGTETDNDVEVISSSKRMVEVGAGRNFVRQPGNKLKKSNNLEPKMRSHSMKSSKAKSSFQKGALRRIKEVIWNLDEEIAKFYEKGAELGVDFKTGGVHKSKKDDVRSSKGRNWDLEEEVRKVVDTGMALGIDFNGREAEVLLYLSSREKEDEDRFDV